MRHRLKFNHLGRKSAHRKALLSKLACDLIEHKRITTTLAKAKALRVYVEPLVTKSKTNTTHQRRVVFSYLQDKEAVSELFGDISAKVGNRPGGYTRIIKLGARLGDAAEMALIELVDYNEVYSNEPAKEGKRKRTRRSGRSHSKSASHSETESSDSAVSGSKTESVTRESKIEETEEEAPSSEEKSGDTSASKKAEKATQEEPEASASATEEKDKKAPEKPDPGEPKVSKEEDSEEKESVEK